MIKSQKISVMLRTAAISAVLLATLNLAACDLAENQLKTDRAANMEIQDFRDGLASRIPLHEQQADMARESDSGIPSLQSYVAAPSESLKPMPLVSISVNQTVPLRDVLFELAKQADYDVELDPRITGSIIFTAREKPFDVVIKRISEISGLRYSFKDDVLRVEVDLPYSKTYKIDYLSYIRKNTSSIRNDISVVTGSGANTGSGFEAASESEADFWAELSANLQQILDVEIARGQMKTSSDPQITAVEQNASVEPIVTPAEGGEGAPNVQVQAPQATLQVNSLPVNAQEASAQDSGSGDARRPSFSVNKQAGIVSVYATERQHNEVVEYLKQVKRSVTSQVLVEAKVLEVSLTDEYNTGINWNEFSLTSRGSLQMLMPQQAFLDSSLAAGGATLTVGRNDVGAVINALQRFGTVRALASPRLTVLNNQSAVLNVAENLVYFELDVETTQDGGGGSTTTIDSEIRNVPEGVLINVQPSINLDDRMISMAVRPTITNVDSFESDPAVELQAAQAGATGQIISQVPVVQVQEFDSVINMNSGEAVIMGGLMQDRVRTNESGVPVLSEIPLLGSAFKSHVDEVSKTELIVFLRATIVEGSNVHATDKELYKMYSDDRRPLDF